MGFFLSPHYPSISHVSIFGTGISMPEPASLVLFGLGLLGLAFASRKKSLTVLAI